MKKVPTVDRPYSSHLLFGFPKGGVPSIHVRLTTDDMDTAIETDIQPEIKTDIDT